jgi:uncharacterized membrane protein
MLWTKAFLMPLPIFSFYTFSFTMTSSNRLPYLDWMRGLAVLIMLQGHVMEGWLRPEDRSGEWFWLSQFLGGLPAPIFLFLVGTSLALLLDRMRSKGASHRQLAMRVVRRSAWILLLAYAFRIEQFLMWYPASQWRDVFRVDTLNCIAVCILLIGLVSTFLKTRLRNIAVMGAATALLAIVTPWIYPLRPNMSDIFLSYFNGNGNSAAFSVVPWAAFAFAGITFGYMLLEGRARVGEAEFFNGVAVAGIYAYTIGSAMSFFPIFHYGFFDYSVTSPHFFLIRLGWVLLIIYGAYKWSTRTSAGSWSPLIFLGQASLVVYWIHMEIVYGRPFHNFARALEFTEATTHLLWVVPLMFATVWVWRQRFRILVPARSSNRVITAE